MNTCYKKMDRPYCLCRHHCTLSRGAENGAGRQTRTLLIETQFYKSTPFGNTISRVPPVLIWALAVGLRALRNASHSSCIDLLRETPVCGYVVTQCAQGTRRRLVHDECKGRTTWSLLGSKDAMCMSVCVGELGCFFWVFGVGGTYAGVTTPVPVPVL